MANVQTEEKIEMYVYVYVFTQSEKFSDLKAPSAIL